MRGPALLQHVSEANARSARNQHETRVGDPVLAWSHVSEELRPELLDQQLVGSRLYRSNPGLVLGLDHPYYRVHRTSINAHVESGGEVTVEGSVTGAVRSLQTVPAVSLTVR